MGSLRGWSSARCRHIVVHGRDGQFGPAHPAPGQADPVEGLRRCHLVDQVQVDVEQVGFSVAGADHVALPYLFGQRGRRACGAHFASPCPTLWDIISL